jgi:uncharacterized protein
LTNIEGSEQPEEAPDVLGAVVGAEVGDLGRPHELPFDLRVEQSRKGVDIPPPKCLVQLAGDVHVGFGLVHPHPRVSQLYAGRVRTRSLRPRYVSGVASADDNRRAVRAAFLPWEQGDSGPFFDLVADDVRWTVIGSTPVSGVYESKQALISGAFGPLLERLDGRLVTRLIDISADGDKVFLQHESSGVTTDGIPYEQVYCFAMKMRDLRIVEIVAYLDTELLARVLPNPSSA